LWVFGLVGWQGHYDVYWQGQGRRSNGKDVNNNINAHAYTQIERESGGRGREPEKSEESTYLYVTHGLECREDEHKAEAQDENHQEFEIHPDAVL